MSPKKIRLAIDTTLMDRRPGKGTAIVIRDSVEELLARSDMFDITLVHREEIPEDVTYTRAREIIIPRVRVPKWSGWLSELLFFLTTKDRFDIYYFPYSRLYPTFWLAPAKKIVWCAMDGGPTTAGYKEKTKGKAPWHTRIFLRYINVITALSGFGKEGIVTTYSIKPNKVHVVYCSPSEVFMNPVQLTSKEELRDRCGINYPYILVVSRFDPHKNIIRIIEAYDLLVKKHKIPHALVFVGGKHIPDYSSKVDECIRERKLEDRVIITPFIGDNDMPSVYAYADCMAFPSLYEGFGLPVIEAMAMQIPVLISNIEALREVSGGYAEVVDPYSVESIANGIKHLLDNRETPQMNERLIKAAAHAKKFSRSSHGDSLVKALLA